MLVLSYNAFRRDKASHFTSYLASHELEIRENKSSSEGLKTNTSERLLHRN